MSVTRIDLHPVVRFDTGFSPSGAELDKMQHRTYRYCFIANTLADSVEINILQPAHAGPDAMLTASILMQNLDADGILRLTLNDPARRNALSEGMRAELAGAFARAGADPAVRVIVIAANGPAFCAGHDLKEMTAGRAGLDDRRTYFAPVLTQCSGVMQSIVAGPKPVIAEVTGVATAAGARLPGRMPEMVDANPTTPGLIAIPRIITP
ncbi:enoyl-CoA hydratase-related protein [Loktanella sp. DJP18]|uniref:enoyl-CoA hydratase-related protein n=1 Tax=Loktanella sp. DJP18 TaxID=3409788 RepID=UPI003BB5DA9C